MRILYVTLGGFLLDLLLGDPNLLTPIHPVVLMGHAITALEKRLRVWFPKTGKGERAAGAVLAFLLPVATLLLSTALLILLQKVWMPLAFLVEVIWCWQALAIRNLRDEAMRVHHALTKESLSEARTAVGRIVGRDTAVLDADGVRRATVETVAENFSDGVVAPLFYMMLGGAPLALCYKSINTMDSMVGYKNEKYLHFGHAAAKLDDAANYVPARMAALFLIAATRLCGENAGEARRIWQRDRRKHASPNSAQCEAAVAGALGIRLCGPAYYFGTLYDKPYIGDDRRTIESEDICRACRLELAGSVLCFLLMGIARLGILWMVKGT